MNDPDHLIVAKWDQTKWLVASSFLFIIPSIYAYYNKLHSYSILILLTSLISANYWRNAVYSWRRNMDIVFANISFIIFASNGIIYIRYLPYFVTGYGGLCILLYCFYLSNTLHKVGNNNWYKYHFMFHLIMVCEQYIILDSILSTDRSLPSP